MIENLLREYEKQTERPDEVIISLAPVQSLGRGGKIALKNLKETHFLFPVIFLTHNVEMSAGANRNASSEIASGDILIYQDADDLPHRQRIEIIKWFFNHYELDHLMHGYIQSFDKNRIDTHLDINKLRFETIPHYGIIHTIANGPIAMSRKVFLQVKWPNENMSGEDCLFNSNVYKFFPNTITIYDSLYLYRRGYEHE